MAVPGEKDPKPGIPAKGGPASPAEEPKRLSRRRRRRGLAKPEAAPAKAKQAGAPPKAPEGVKGAFQGLDKKAPPAKKDEKPGSGVALPQWSRKKFVKAPELKDATPAGSQMNQLAVWFHKHPYRSFSALALILLLIVLDVAMIFGRFSAVEWAMLNFAPNSPMARFYKSENPGNVFLTASDPLPGLGPMEVPRSTEPLYGLWEPVKAPASAEVKGILDKKEARELKLKGLKDVAPSGISSYMGLGKAPENLGRTILLSKAPGAPSPYGPAYDGVQEGVGAANKPRIDPKLAKRGESMNRILPESEFAGVAPEEEEEQAPEGDVGEEVLAELARMNPEKVSRFAAKHGWTLNKHDSDPEMPKLPKDGLGKSWAAWQLLETMRLNDKASSCATCMPETRINKGRAQFFGEKR